MKVFYQENMNVICHSSSLGTTAAATVVNNTHMFPECYLNVTFLLMVFVVLK